eukprot:COSAG01_NODE_8524_length_2753_cov_3.678222_3_plen_80_part_00
MPLSPAVMDAITADDEKEEGWAPPPTAALRSPLPLLWGGRVAAFDPVADTAHRRVVRHVRAPRPAHGRRRGRLPPHHRR